MDEPAQQEQQLFVLRAELRGGHKEDVRALAVLSDGSLASGSRDRTIVIWKREGSDEVERDGAPPPGRSLSASSTLLGHGDYVTCLCPLPRPPGDSPDLREPLPSPSLLSGGRDKLGILWDVASAEPAWRLGPGAHRWGVSAVAARPEDDRPKDGSGDPSSSCAALFTASLDGTVAQWDLPPSGPSPPSLDRPFPAERPSRVLRGHEGPVQAALVLPGSRALVTASSDRSVRIWLPEATAGGAASADGAAAAASGAASGAAGAAESDLPLLASVPSVSASATIKDAHDDTVRGLALLPLGADGGEGVGPDATPGYLLVTVGHDALVKLWRLPPALLSTPARRPARSSSPSPAELAPTLAATLVGHTALVYGAAAPVAAGGSGSSSGKGKGPASGSAVAGPLLATASEDGTARVWRRVADAACECVSTLRHPGCVWAAAWLPDGDLATACSDGVVRLWTPRGSGREAPEAELAALVEALAARDEAPAREAAPGAPSSAGALPAGLKLSEPSILSRPGRPGQTAVVRDAATGAAAVFEFDGAAGEWQRLGDVVGGADAGDNVASASTWLRGRQWDHVFDVDVADGAPPLKLPYNRGENPYDAADRFLENEGLPQSYRQQVVEHIIACTGGASAPSADVSVNVDPFTGGGAYVPGTAMNPGGGFGGGVGGGGGVTGGGADPFTGTAAAAARAAAAAPPATPRAYVLFDATPRAEAVASKARELAAAAPSSPPLLSESEAAPGGDLDALVDASISSSSASSSSSAVPRASLALLDRMLRGWPASALFPVLDLARLVALSEEGSAALAGGAGGDETAEASPSTTTALCRAVLAALSPSPDSSSPAAAKVTAARAIANAVRHPPLRSWATLRAGELAEALAPVASAAAGASGAAATAAASAAAALYNLCLSVASPSPSSPPPPDAAPRLLSAISGVLGEGSVDDAVGGYAAAGAAALCSASAESAALAVDLGLREAAARALLQCSSSASSSGADAKPRLAEAAGELARVLSGKG